MAFKVAFGLLALVAAVFASPAAGVQELQARASDDNIVYVTDAQKYWWATLIRNDDSYGELIHAQ